MTTELFAAQEAGLTLPLQDADVTYWPRIQLPRSADGILQELVTQTPWRSQSIVVWGKQCMQPRLIAWYGDAGAQYAYSGIRLQPLGWTPLLQRLKACVEATCGHTFNSLLINFYRDHHDSIGFHSDNEPELGPQPVIASLTFGEARTFVLRHKTDKATPPFRIALGAGSLLVMQGDTQANWKHGIEKLSRPCGPRVNLTFRRILGTT